MDINGLKGRIAEALVEGIFRRAGYQAALVGRESRVAYMLKAGSVEFLPDMLVWKRVAGGASMPALERLVAIEVKYRADVEKALQREVVKLAKATEQWRDLYFIFVTDQPRPGRACFQAVNPQQCRPGTPWETMDLHEVSDLDIYWRTIEEYEGLVRLIFPILSGPAHAHGPARRPEAAPVAPLAALRGR